MARKKPKVKKAGTPNIASPTAKQAETLMAEIAAMDPAGQAAVREALLAGDAGKVAQVLAQSGATESATEIAKSAGFNNFDRRDAASLVDDIPLAEIDDLAEHRAPFLSGQGRTPNDLPVPVGPGRGMGNAEYRDFRARANGGYPLEPGRGVIGKAASAAPDYGMPYDPRMGEGTGEISASELLGDKPKPAAGAKAPTTPKAAALPKSKGAGFLAKLSGAEGGAGVRSALGTGVKALGWIGMVWMALDLAKRALVDAPLEQRAENASRSLNAAERVRNNPGAADRDYAQAVKGAERYAQGTSMLDVTQSGAQDELMAKLLAQNEPVLAQAAVRSAPSVGEIYARLGAMR